jgi:hypothetical protein
MTPNRSKQNSVTTCDWPWFSTGVNPLKPVLYLSNTQKCIPTSQAKQKFHFMKDQPVNAVELNNHRVL